MQKKKKKANAEIFVYKCQINKTKPLEHCFLREMKQVYRIDEYVYRMKMTYDIFFSELLEEDLC